MYLQKASKKQKIKSRKKKKTTLNLRNADCLISIPSFLQHLFTIFYFFSYNSADASSK